MSLFSEILLLLFYNFFGIEVVIWIAIIGDKRTSIQVAGKLELLCVDLVHGYNERLTINLDDSLVSRDSCCRKFSINMRIGLDVASNDLQIDTVRGLSIWIMLALWSLLLLG